LLRSEQVIEISALARFFLELFFPRRVASAPRALSFFVKLINSETNMTTRRIGVEIEQKAKRQRSVLNGEKNPGRAMMAAE